MRKRKWLALVVLCCLVPITLLGCSKGGDTPVAVRVKFWSAIRAGDWEKARTFMTKEGKQLVDLFDMKSIKELDEREGFVLLVGDSAQLTITGDTAVETAFYTDGHDNCRIEIHTVKVGGKWLIQQLKVRGLPR